MRACLMFVSLIANAAFAQTSNLSIYNDTLNASFHDWSWGTHAMSASPAHSGGAAISFTPAGWGGLLFADSVNQYSVADYQTLSLWIHGGNSGGQVLRLSILNDGSSLADLEVAAYTAGGGIAAGTWRQVIVPFDVSTGLTSGGFNQFQVMDFTGGSQNTVYIDDVVFNARTTPLPSSAQTVSVNLLARRHFVSDDIYGVAFGDAARNQAVGYTVRRWGGNSVTRYNWQGVEHNSASDWFFIDYPPSQTDSADAFIDEARSAGAKPLITIPTIGWAPIDDRVGTHWGFSVAKYGAQLATEFSGSGGQSWANADAGNGECNPSVNHSSYCVADSPGASHGLIIGNDPHDTSIAAPPSFEAQWIAHIQSRVGTAAGGGVKYYALDNESMLWNSTHRDVHPSPPTYDEIWQKAVDYGNAIKSQEPAAKIFGPVTWGWCDLFTDAADAARGPSCIDGLDRQAHAGVPFVQWYLQQVCNYQAAHGVRLVDYLDVHIYPQGDGSHDLAGTDPNHVDESGATSAWRLRSLKELYDPNYLQESWIADRPQWIPRLRSWINASCPGTKLAITEYKWGPDNGASGALAQAEALAIFGREGVDLATRWVAPSAGSYAEDAFRLYLDYDGAHARVTGHSTDAVSSDVDSLGAYVVHKAGQHVYVLLFNKSTVPQDITVNLSNVLTGNWQWYQFDGAHHLNTAGNGSIAANTITLNGVAARSANLLVLPDNEFLFVDGYE